MTEMQEYELRPFIDDLAKAARGGLRVSESRPTRGPKFGEYVVKPALLFGILTTIVSAGMIAALAVFLRWILPGASHSFAVALAGCSVASGAIVMAYAAIMLMDDWRSLQVRTIERTMMGQPKRDTQRGRIMTKTSSGTRRITRLEWPMNTDQALARRVYNERAEWIGGDKVVRDRHLKGLIGANSNFDAAKDDLRMWGYIDDQDRWTEKARTVLLNKLVIT